MAKRMSERAAAKTRHQLAKAWQVFQDGDVDSAETGVRAVLRRAPRDPDALGFLGALLMQQGRMSEAVPPLQRAAALRPDDPAISYNLGSALAGLGRSQEAAQALRRSLDEDPVQPEAWVNLGNVLQGLDDRQGAIDCYETALRQAPQLVEPRNNMGAALLYEGRLDDAEAVLREAVRLSKGYAAAWNNLGSVLKSRGDLTGAADALRQALQLEPGMGEALANLLDIDPEAGSTEDALQLAAVADSEAASPEDRIAAGFAAGRLFARLGRYDEAFGAYCNGNALRAEADRARGQGFDRDAHRAFVDDLLANYPASGQSNVPPIIDADQTPLFVLGMPRSGTTLVEQILSSHPSVTGAGEVPYLAEAVAAVGGPAAAAALQTQEALSVGEVYVAKLRALAPPGAARITDKTPTNFLHIGALARMLPGARIIHCRRDAADTCLSCYFQNFGRGHSFTNDLVDLGSYYSDYRRLMDHWHAALPDRILDIDYEALVAEPEPEIRKLLGFCELSWEPACLEFHKNPRAVLTASNAQVRRRLYSTSVARWRPYEAHLGPLFDQLGPAAPD